MKLARMLVVCSAIAIPAAMAQSWEVGGGAGAGFYTSHDVNHPDGTSASAKIQTGVSGAGWVANNTSDHWGGELRYAFQMGDLKLSREGQEVTFGAESHTIHYDFLWHGTPAGSRVRPYVAFGGGIKYYRGTGTEVLVQPLSRYALLTKTNELQGLVSIGAGVKWKIGNRWQFRVDVHDYITPFPKEVITPNQGSEISGWTHDIVPMFGIAFTN